MAELRWSEQALDDLDAVCLFIARDAPIAAKIFASKAFETSDRLEDAPRLGRVVPELGMEIVREVFVGSYRLIYRYHTDWDVVEVLTLHHGARLLKLDLSQ